MITWSDKVDKEKIDYGHHALVWESSQLSQKSYCRSHELNYGKFVAARSRLQASRGKTRVKPKFVKIQPKSLTDNLAKEFKSKQAATLSIKFPNGSSLDIPLNLSLEQYNNVFTGLKAVL